MLTLIRDVKLKLNYVIDRADGLCRSNLDYLKKPDIFSISY